MNTHRILIIDDDKRILNFLDSFLNDHEFEIFITTDGKDVKNTIDEKNIDIALVDLRLHNESGLEIAKEIHHHCGIPIIMISGIKDDIEKIVGLESAIDDFVEKPFNPRLLLAKIRAILRRTGVRVHPTEKVSESIQTEATHCFDEFQLDSKRCTLTKKDFGDIEMTNTEFRLLELFVTNPNTIFSRFDLIEKLGLESSTNMMRSIDVLVLRVRRKIEINPSRPKYLQTRRNKGYIFCLDSLDNKTN